MVRPSLLRTPLILLGAIFLGATGCGSNNDTGPPALREFIVMDSSGMEIDLLAPADGGRPAASPLFPFRASFTQLLDGDKIEDVLEGGAVEGRKDVATITWMGAPAGAPAITAITSYNPAGSVGATMPKPTVTIRGNPGLPSAAKLTVKLSRDKITGKKGAPFTGSDTHMVETEPFAVELSVTDDAEVTPALMLTAKFNNLPGNMLASKIKVTSGGMPVTVMATADAADLRTVAITPPGGMWMLGATYTVSLGAEVTDLFGVKLAEPVSATFKVVSMPTDGGRPPSDAGAPGDGGVDAVTSPDAAADASPGG
jgi:hypothetical protein